MSNNQVLICSRNMGSIAGSQLEIGSTYGKILKIKCKFVSFSKSNFFGKKMNLQINFINLIPLRVLPKHQPLQ